MKIMLINARCCDNDDSDDVHDHDLKLLRMTILLYKNLISAGITDLYPVIEFGYQ